MRLPVMAAMMACLALLAGCRQAGDPFVLESRLFVFNYRVAEARYLVTLRRNEASPDAALLVARFENPAGGGEYSGEWRIFPAQEKLVAESTPLTCVRKDRPYAIRLEIRAADGRVLQSIETTAKSDVDQDVLPARPLVTGPAYDRNDAAYGEDGKALRMSMADCPARKNKGPR